MVGRLGRIALRCDARTHVIVELDRFERVRCTDARCPEVQAAKARGKGEKVIHVFDRTRSYEMTTEFEMPAEAGHEME